MKIPFILLTFLICLTPQWAAAKSQKETAIETASQFQFWCKHLSYRHFRQKKQNPYNWSSSTIRQLNDYQTSGSWKVNNVEHAVFCQIRKGRKAKYTKIQIR